jgi:hypothetical protein
MGWVIFRFVLIGPAIGSFVFAFISGAHGLSANTYSVSDFVNAIPVGLYGLVFAYPLAGLPAAVSGVLYSLALKRRSRNLDPMARLLLGGVIGGLCGLAFGNLLSVGEPFTSYLPAWASSGVVGGAFGALSVGDGLFERVHPTQATELES